MELSVLMELVNQVAFPIIVAGACGWYVKYITDQNREQINSILNLHHSEMNDITTALNNNTLAVNELITYLKKEDD